MQHTIGGAALLIAGLLPAAIGTLAVLTMEKTWTPKAVFRIWLISVAASCFFLNSI